MLDLKRMDTNLELYAWYSLLPIMGCGLKHKLNEKVDQSVMRWYGHMERMMEERLVKRIYRAGVGGTRGRGRPRTRWHVGVKGVR